MIFQPEYAEDISISSFESVSNLSAKENNCLCVYIFPFY